MKKRPKFKKYILSQTNTIFVRTLLTPSIVPVNNRSPYILASESHLSENRLQCSVKIVEKNVQYGDEFYAFIAWFKYPLQDRTMCVLPAKGSNFFGKAIKKETNNFLRYLFWRIIYHRQNFDEYRRWKKNVKSKKKK